MEYFLVKLDRVFRLIGGLLSITESQFLNMYEQLLYMIPI